MEADMSSVDDKNVKIETEGIQSIEDLTNSNTQEANIQENDKQQQNDAALKDLMTESTDTNKHTQLALETKTSDSITSEKSLLNRNSSLALYTQPKHKSKTCINCGSKYGNFKKSVRSMTDPLKCSLCKKLKPQGLSADGKRSQLSSYCNCNHNLEIPNMTRSKCSQLSKNSSHRSIAPCQSFDQCSTCNQVIFATQPLCASFDFCKSCKKVTKNSSPNSCHSQQRDLKVRSVTFSACDDNIQDEKIIQKTDCSSNISQTSSFCGCNSTLKCKKPCEKKALDCSDVKKSISNMSFCPPKEPSQLSMMKRMLQERIDACSNIQLKTQKKESNVSMQQSLSKPKRHLIRKINENTNDLECPSNPCCISDERKVRMETVTNKLVQREGIRQKKIQQQREERLKRLQKNQCDGMDECKKDGKCAEDDSNDKCKAYCKKYKKMKYEIELQNYLVDKLNRDLQIKISENYPETIVQELNTDLEREIMKLKEMIEFTIFEQCQNKDLGWGTIPISPLTSKSISIPQSSCGIPKSPSCISSVSTFSMLEELNLSQEKEKHELQIEFQNNKQKHMTMILNEIKELECKICELKSSQLQLSNSIGSLYFKKSNDKKISKKTKLVAKTKKVEQIKTIIDKAKEDIEKIHVEIHLIRNET